MPEQNQQDDGQAVDDPSVALQAAPDAMPPNDAFIGTYLAQAFSWCGD